MESFYTSNLQNEDLFKFENKKKHVDFLLRV